MGIIDFVKNVFTGNWQGAWESVKKIFSSIFGGIGEFAKKPLNFIIKGINQFIKGINKIKIPDWIPGLGGKGFSIPSIPMLADGGILTSGSAIVGEAGAELLSMVNGKAVLQPLTTQYNEPKKSDGIIVNNYITSTPSTAFEVAEQTRRTLKQLELCGVI